MSTNVPGQKVIDVLQNAVGQAISLQEKGLRPDEAMEKVASDMRLSPSLIERTSHILNRASLNGRRLYGDDLRDKLASVEIIEPEKVIAKVYGLQVKQAKSPSPISENLQKRLEACVAECEARNASQVKTASVKEGRCWEGYEPVPGKEPYSPGSCRPKGSKAKDKKDKKKGKRKEKKTAGESLAHGLYHGLSGIDLVRTRQKLHSQRKEAAAELARIFSKAQQSIDALSFKLASLSPNQQAEVIDHGKLYFESRNPAAKLVLMQLADELPAESQAKMAAVPRLPAVWNDHLLRGNIANEAADIAEQITSMRERCEPLVRKVAEASARLELIDSSIVDGHRVQRLGVNPRGPFRELDEAWIRKKTAAASDASLYMNLHQTLSDLGKRKEREKASPRVPSDVEKFTVQLRNPQHESALSSVRSRAALQELLALDPVIKGYDPKEVMMRFNELSAFAPGATEHVASLRAALRQALQGNTSLFDLEQVRKSERDAPFPFPVVNK